jgi:hypothetical protein
MKTMARQITVATPETAFKSGDHGAEYVFKGGR